MKAPTSSTPIATSTTITQPDVATQSLLDRRHRHPGHTNTPSSDDEAAAMIRATRAAAATIYGWWNSVAAANSAAVSAGVAAPTRASTQP